MYWLRGTAGKVQGASEGRAHDHVGVHSTGDLIMASCKYCYQPMSWGMDAGGKYVALVPIELHDGLPRTFQDENGVLRASHRDVCTAERGAPLVRVARLAVKVQPENIIGEPKKVRRPRKKVLAETSASRALPF